MLCLWIETERKRERGNVHNTFRRDIDLPPPPQCKWSQELLLLLLLELFTFIRLAFWLFVTYWPKLVLQSQNQSNCESMVWVRSVQWCSNYMFNKLCARCCCYCCWKSCRTMISGFLSFAASHHTLQINALYYETENSNPYIKLS